jgi:hypothetical protein
MRPLLRGELAVTALDPALDVADAQRDGLEYYQTLVARNFNKILCDVHWATHRLVAAADRASWSALVRAYRRSAPCDQSDPNEFARGFPEFLATGEGADLVLAALGPTRAALVRLAHQLADLCWLRHAVAVARIPEEGDSPDPQLDEVGLDRWVFVRGYDADTLGWTAAIARGEPFAVELVPTALIVHQHRLTRLSRVVRASPPMVAVIGARAGLPAAAAWVAAHRDAADPAAAELVRLGVLPPPRATEVSRSVPPIPSDRAPR